VHRIGALVTAAVLGFLAWRAIRTGRSSAVRAAGAALAVLLVAQWTVGPLMVLKALPLELATTHNAIAALLVLTMVALLRFLWTPRTLR
jgi:cytochrome c oxidase assembly protein subunit 15